MDAYVLGTHSGNLPTELLGVGEDRVRAIARLDGPEFDVFYAIEGTTAAAIEAIVNQILQTGTNAKINLGSIGHPQYRAVTHGPSRIPPWDRIRFAVYQDGDLTAALEAAVERLGEDGVGAATDGHGLVLVEFGAEDEATLDTAIADFEAAVEGGASAGFHDVDKGGLQTR